MLQEKLIQEIEKGMGLTGLKDAWDSEEVVELVPTKVFHHTENEHRQLITNIQNDVPKEKWEEAKRAGEEMPIKDLKKEYDLDFEGKSAKALYEHMLKKIELSKETDSTKIKSEYENDIQELRKNLQLEKDKYVELQETIKTNRINNYVKNLVNQDDIIVPPHLTEDEEIKSFVNIERRKNELLFTSMHKFDIDDYNNIIAKDIQGNILKDDTQSPIKVDNIYQDFKVKNFMNLKEVKAQGRGEGDIFPSRDMTRFKDAKEAMAWYNENKGVKYGTSEMDAIQAEFGKNK